MTDICRRNDQVTGEEYKENAERVDPWDFFIKPWHIGRNKALYLKMPRTIQCLEVSP
jgi:hypothetical protein